MIFPSYILSHDPEKYTETRTFEVKLRKTLGTPYSFPGHTCIPVHQGLGSQLSLSWTWRGVLDVVCTYLTPHGLGGDMSIWMK